MKKLISFIILLALSISLFGCAKAPIDQESEQLLIGQGKDYEPPLPSENSDNAVVDKTDAKDTPATSDKTDAKEAPVTKTSSTNLMKGFSAGDVKSDADLLTYSVKTTDFGVRLFKKSYDKNVLVSPISVMSVLAMTMNGAEGNTLLQMENTLGITRAEINNYISSYSKAITNEGTSKISTANSIWFADDPSYTVKDSFLQINADYYNADVFLTPMNKKSISDINAWVNEKTFGMIPTIIDRIPPGRVMYLINAVAFDAKWETVYENKVTDTFKCEDGTLKKTEFMYGNVKRYIEDENTTGFIKYYDDPKYAFVALLPNEDITIKDYVNTLDGEKINSLITNVKNNYVNTRIPEFEINFFTDMTATLSDMGMTDVFSKSKADLSSLATVADESYNISIDEVIQKTHISVDENGTKAAAVTGGSGVVSTSSEAYDIKFVHLNRPFVYMIIERMSNTPIFIGALTDIE